MASTVAEVMVSTLRASRVPQLYGMPGDSLNGFTGALRRDGGINWQHVRHEEAGTILSGGGDQMIELARTNLREVEVE